MMDNLIVKQILYQKNIPLEIEQEIVQFLPLPDQEKKKKEMIRKLNIRYKYYWDPGCWGPRKCRAPRLKTYKRWRKEEERLEF